MNREAKKEPVGAIQRAVPQWPGDVFEEMEQMMERFMPRSMLRPWRWEKLSWMSAEFGAEGRVPSVDLIDGDTEVILRAELPGVEKKDLDVSVNDNSATIKGKVEREEKTEEGDYYRCERMSGAYQRVVALPAAVDANKGQASFKNGLLELRLSKLAQSKRHKVKID